MSRTDLSALAHYQASFDAERLIRRFTRDDATAKPGLITNFLGVRVPPRLHPRGLEPLLGTVEGPPAPGTWHACIAEWAGALRAVAQAQGGFRIIELGCGWGCWLTNMGRAARSQGMRPDLIGIEANPAHLRDAGAILAMNGLAGCHALHHGVAGPAPGEAIFPAPDGPDWGGEAIFDPDPATLEAARHDPARQVLPVRTLDDLAGGAPVDLLHIDIQGAEAQVVPANLPAMQRLVARVLIGTHSRAIEGGLMEVMLTAGWKLEVERPALIALKDGVPELRVDGVQMWANPRLARPYI